MNAPLVYVTREALALSAGKGEMHHVWAAVLDDGAVFHVLAAPPRVPYGQPCLGVVAHPDATLTFTQQGVWVVTGPTPYALVRYGDQKAEVDVHIIPDSREIYSRSQGLLETDVLAQKHVMIVGLGSGGSQIAVELAKAGVGQFTLVDFDRIDLSNVARHVAGVHDLGRMKTAVMRDIILQKNPAARINLLNIDIDHYLNEIAAAVERADLLIAATDNNRSRFNLNALALQHKTPMLVGRATTRAAGGDVLRVRPYQGPCYSCLFGSGLLGQEERSSMRQLRPQTPAYVPDAEIQATIQVGLASDIAPISNMVVKLALVELSRGLESGLTSLETDLQADFYLWGNRREDLFAKWPPLGYSFQQNSILRWYGVRVNRNPTCAACGDHTQAPVEGEDFFGPA